MTAKQKANRERFKKVVGEAKKLRAKNKNLTQAQAVKQAWAMMYKTKSVGATKPTKKKKTAKVEKHIDTKSHNVKIDIVSGAQKKYPVARENMAYKVRDIMEKDLKYWLSYLETLKKSLKGAKAESKVLLKTKISRTKIVIAKNKKALREQNSLINSLLK